LRFDAAGSAGILRLRKRFAFRKPVTSLRRQIKPMTNQVNFNGRE
jgi:hypothetical protein